MQKLVEGVHYFQKIGFAEHQELFRRLKSGQRPEACFITCADSRIDPNLITHSKPGQLFILRNVGNLVPCFGTSNNGELAAVEYALVALGVEHIVVCGHTGCGAMTSLVAPQSPAPPAVGEWLRHAAATREIVREHYHALKGDALISAAAEENVLVQLEHLRTYPVVASRLAAGKVHLHGWMYKIDTGEVFHYDAQAGQFVKFGSEPVGGSNAAAAAAAAERSTSRRPRDPKATG